jgi:uncharacterized protein YjbI with pentapeptide repeats
VDLRYANLSGANLSEAWLYETDFFSSDLSEANLSGTHSSRADFDESDLCYTNLSRADLTMARFFHANLSEAILNYADLGEAIFCMANLRGANLRNTRCVEADLSEANLSAADLSEANLSGANLYKSDLTQANLTKANLNRASFVESTLEGADLSYSSVYGISAWNLKTNQDTKQKGLMIAEEDEPIINVDNIEIAQFIYLLLRHENLRQVINSVTERGVLILGRFGGGGIEVLRAIAEKLRELKYLPIIFDFDRPRNRNYTETIKTLAGLSRFVVVDLSGPSVPQELYATVPHFKIPFVPILEKGKQQYAMFSDILEYDWVMKPIVEFDTTESLINSIPSKVIKPAERRLEKRQRLLLELFGK